MNFISRIFTKTPVDPVFQEFLNTYNKSLRRSNNLLVIFISLFILSLSVFIFSSSSTVHLWSLSFTIFSFVVISFIIAMVLNLHVKDNVLQKLSFCHIYNKDAILILRKHLSSKSYITVEQLDHFIACELSYNKIYQHEEKTGTKALLLKSDTFLQ